VRTSIAIVLALFAAFCLALGSLIRQSSARRTHGRALRFRLLVTLLREGRWLAGTALTVFSFCVRAAALAFGPLALAASTDKPPPQAAQGRQPAAQ
jgi:hypothetical protein